LLPAVFGLHPGNKKCGVFWEIEQIFSDKIVNSADFND